MILDILNEHMGTIIAGAVGTFIGFLFAKDGILFKIFESKEKKALREDSHKDNAILELTKRVDALSKKYDESMRTIKEQDLTIQAQNLRIQELTFEIHTLTEESHRNNKILEFIRKWMKDKDIPTDLLEILEYHTKPIK